MFSAGQKQLLCLARALLHKNKIILLDEATANVDIMTEQIIQKAVRYHFSDCTVLTIAHRLRTIIESDRIVFMQDGKAVEIGHPFELMTIQ